MIKETVLAELERVKAEIDSDEDQERATLEGWEQALLWVLVLLEEDNR
jgi:hypothetical protein